MLAVSVSSLPPSPGLYSVPVEAAFPKRTWSAPTPGTGPGEEGCTLGTLSPPHSPPSSPATLGAMGAPRGWFHLHHLLGDGRLLSIPVSLHAVCL